MNDNDLKALIAEYFQQVRTDVPATDALTAVLMKAFSAGKSQKSETAVAPA